jgi:hypothetical protein
MPQPYPGADPDGGLQGVQAAALAHLTGADRAVEVATRSVVTVLHDGQEAVQRLAGGVVQGVALVLVGGSRVFRNARLDRAGHVPGDRVDVRPEVVGDLLEDTDDRIGRAG